MPSWMPLAIAVLFATILVARIVIDLVTMYKARVFFLNIRSLSIEAGEEYEERFLQSTDTLRALIEDGPSDDAEEEESRQLLIESYRVSVQVYLNEIAMARDSMRKADEQLDGLFKGGKPNMDVLQPSSPVARSHLGVKMHIDKIMDAELEDYQRAFADGEWGHHQIEWVRRTRDLLKKKLRHMEKFVELEGIVPLRPEDIDQRRQHGAGEAEEAGAS